MPFHACGHALSSRAIRVTFSHLPANRAGVQPACPPNQSYMAFSGNTRRACQSPSLLSRQALLGMSLKRAHNQPLCVTARAGLFWVGTQANEREPGSYLSFFLQPSS